MLVLIPPPPESGWPPPPDSMKGGIKPVPNTLSSYDNNEFVEKLL